jgi:hypothetical protein
MHPHPKIDKGTTLCGTVVMPLLAACRFRVCRPTLLEVGRHYSAGGGQFVIVHLDKKNAQEAVATAQSETGKSVERVEEK